MICSSTLLTGLFYFPGVPELPAIAQTKWIVTHLGTQISLNQAFASLKIVCDVSYLEGKQLQKEDMTDLLKNLDSDTFQKFLENLKRNADDVNSNCPKFAESITH